MRILNIILAISALIVSGCSRSYSGYGGNFYVGDEAPPFATVLTTKLSNAGWTYDTHTNSQGVINIVVSDRYIEASLQIIYRQASGDSFPGGWYCQRHIKDLKGSFWGQSPADKLNRLCDAARNDFKKTEKK